jgi:hypothetical protein
MNKAIGFLAWTFVFFTIIALVLTLFTTHQIQYIEYHFKYYYILQVCLFFTMIFWSIKLFKMTTGSRKIIYPLICIFFAIGSVLFMYLGVY